MSEGSAEDWKKGTPLVKKKQERVGRSTLLTSQLRGFGLPKKGNLGKKPRARELWKEQLSPAEQPEGTGLAYLGKMVLSSKKKSKKGQKGASVLGRSLKCNATMLKADGTRERLWGRERNR